MYELLDSFCKEHDVHEACLHCREHCKIAYKPWSSQIPYSEFCDNFIPSLLAEFEALLCNWAAKVMEDLDG